MTLETALFVCEMVGGLPDAPEDLFGEKPEDGTGYCAVGNIQHKTACYRFAGQPAVIAAMRASKRWCEVKDNMVAADARALIEKDAKLKAETAKGDWKKPRVATLAALGITDAEYAEAKRVPVAEVKTKPVEVVDVEPVKRA